MEPRTLRAANALLYGSSVLLVIAAVLYCALYKDMPVWQLWGGVVLSLAAAVWGLYYVTLSYRITAEGVSTHAYLQCTRRLLWADTERITLEESDSNGIASCHIILHPKSGKPLRISSDVLPLDDVQELAADLRHIGLLPPAESQESAPADTP
ncbi:MAG: hypothetical protein IJN29_02150 [Akkermansia sp.]|nr:hypothetical protein [Akkermansia sp.]